MKKDVAVRSRRKFKTRIVNEIYGITTYTFDGMVCSECRRQIRFNINRGDAEPVSLVYDCECHKDKIVKSSWLELARKYRLSGSTVLDGLEFYSI